MYAILSLHQNLSNEQELFVPQLITGLAADSSGAYVALTGPTLNKYDAAGNLLAQTIGGNPSSFDALATSGGRLYVAVNVPAHGVYAILSLHQNLSNEQELFVPQLITGLAVDSSGVYVAMGNKIFEYDFSGNVLASYTGSASDDFTALAISPAAFVAAPAPQAGRGALGLLGLVAAGWLARRQASAC